MAEMVVLTGAVMDTYGQYMQGKALQDQAKTEADILNYNAKIKDREADLALERARAEADKFKSEGDVFKAEQNVALAKGGVLTTTGSPQMVIEQTAFNINEDRKMILREGFLSQSALFQQGEGLRYEARAAKARGANIRQANNIRTITTGLSATKRVVAAFGGGSILTG